MARTNIISEYLGLLRADLERQFVLQGRTHKHAGLLQLLTHCLHPRFLPLILCRLSRASFLLGIPLLPFIFSYLNLILFGLQITPRCEIGGGLFLPHPSGVVVG
jgi:serine O-acetyltransferase